MNKPRIGLALGSGSARGWAHIGVLRALNEAGIQPDVVCGTSIGALVGAAYASNNLDALEQWVCSLDRLSIARLMDVTLASGGLIEGEKLMAAFNERIRETQIEELPREFAAVATDLHSGREIWLQEGSLSDAVRSSLALPGLFTPFQRDELCLVDGGLVNPVPVSLCRAMGAEFIIAVDLNDDIIGRHLREEKSPEENKEAAENDLWNQFLNRYMNGIWDKTVNKLNGVRRSLQAPGLFDVMASAINIMQHNITKSRMASDPPDVTLTPRLAHIGLLEFDRAAECIQQGRDSVTRQLSKIKHAMDTER